MWRPGVGQQPELAPADAADAGRGGADRGAGAGLRAAAAAADPRGARQERGR